MAQGQKIFNEFEKELDCFSAALQLSNYQLAETPISQQELKYILEDSGDFERIKSLQNIKPNDIVVFLEKTDGLNPYKHAFVVKNSKRETLLTRPVKGQKVTLSNLKLEFRKRNSNPYNTRIYRLKSLEDIQKENLDLE